MEKLAFVLVFVLVGVFALSRNDVQNERIIGGVQAPTGAYPYQVSLRNRANKHFCGGSIIGPKWILTAAHCLVGEVPSNVVVFVGTNKLNAGGKVYRASKVIPHNEYNATSNRNDIALLQLRTSIQYNELIQPIALNEKAVPPHSLCILSGWGLMTYPSNTFPNDLQYTTTYSITYEQCAEKLSSSAIFETNLCTFFGSEYGACSGDSGGPLVSGGVQVGVVSWGIPCGVGYPDVFTDVASYRDWIRENLGI